MRLHITNILEAEMFLSIGGGTHPCLWMDASPHQSCSVTPSADQGRQILMKGQGEITHQLLSQAEQARCGEISLIPYQLSQSTIMRNEAEF